jgi:hypothetical protein
MRINDKCKYILWHVDPLLGNDRDVSNYTTAVARECLSSDRVRTPTDTYATVAQQQMNGVFSVVLAEMF